MLKIIPLMSAALLALSVPLIAQDGGPVLRVDGGEDQIVQIRAKTRHTTVIVLPQTENVLDFVVGDSEYWHLTGAANLAFLKPIAEGVTTNVALVCESGRIYSFLVTEQSTGQPHLVVRIDQQGEADPRISPVKHEPAFVARRQVAAYQQMAETAIKTARAAQMDADSRIADTAALAEGESEAFRADYPTRLKFPYRLEDKAHKWPFLVEGMWHDGQFTYLRSNAQESPALYEEKDGKPSLVAYDLGEDGLYIARHVLGHGWLQIGKQRVRWRFAAAGDRAMIEWKRLYVKPAGSLPGGVVTQWGVGAITVFVLLFLTYWIWLGGGEPAELPGATETATTAPRSFTDQMTARVDAETLRAETKRAAADRALRARQQRKPTSPDLLPPTKRPYLPGRVPTPGNPTPRKNGNSGSACAWKPSSGAAVRFAVRRLHRATANWTAAAGAPGSGSLIIPHPQKMKARKPCNTRLTQCTRSQPALKMKSRRRPRRIKRLSRHSAVRRPRPKLPRLFPP